MKLRKILLFVILLGGGVVAVRARMWPAGPVNPHDVAAVSSAPDAGLGTASAVQAAPANEPAQDISFEMLSGYRYDWTKADGATAPDDPGGKGNIPASLQELNGKKVSLQGFMIPVAMDGDKVQAFVLLAYLPSCCFGGVPRPNDWVMARLPEGKAIEARAYSQVSVTGIFDVGESWEKHRLQSIYRIQVESVRGGQ